MSSNKNTKFKCPFCDKRLIKTDLVTHVDEKHDDMIPQGFTAFQLVFNYVNRKPLDYHGRCTECKGPTKWDENKGRYDRQCGNPKCKESYLKKFEDNMMKTKGVTRISSTAEGQEKMLANRKISGTYKFQNGVEKTYTGSYELKTLEFMDKVLNINPDDIMCPGPVLEYTYKGEKHMYITDFYYVPYNLVIEVKDGGKNPNKRNMPDYRGKQIAKEEYIIKNTNYNYLRLTDNDLSQLMSVFADLKMQMVEETGERVIHVNEAFVSNNKCRIYSCFAGVGKNYSIDRLRALGYKVDSIEKYRDFYKIYPTKNHLINDINRRSKLNDILFIPYFLGIDERFLRGEIEYTIIYPDKKLKNEYIKRFKNLGFTLDQIKYLNDNFNLMIEDIENSTCNKIKLNSGEYCFEKINKPFSEAMNALMSGYIPGMRDSGSTYVVNYMQNNVFSGEEERGYGVSDNIKLTNLIIRDKEGKLNKAPDNFLENCKYDVFQVNISPEEVSKKLESYIGEFVSESFLYESLFNKKMYTYDQIYTEESAKPIDDFYYTMNQISEATREFILTGNIKNKHPEDKLDTLRYSVECLLNDSKINTI